MIHLTKALVRRWLDALLHVHDTPERTAAAFAMGCFMGFSPFLGLHTVIALAVAFVFGLNRVAALLGVYPNLPWIIGGYYIAMTMLGAAITQTRLPTDFREHVRGLLELSIRSADFWERLGMLLRPLILPYTVGSLIGCTIIALVVYPVALAFVRRSRSVLHPHRSDTSPKC